MQTRDLRTPSHKNWALTLVFFLAGPALSAEKAEVSVILWFDTEDYLLPADDDAAKRLAEILSRRAIRATFKLVGEKARVLEKRGRKDVIDALKKHDIGYHSNFHSVHPAPAEYLAEYGWTDGVAEFVRRERQGAEDVRRIFGVETLSCYGQPGSSWAPQTLGALPLIGVAPHGVPCYVDEGDHVGLGGQPFWYCGALTVYHMSPNWTRMDLYKENGLEEGCAAFRRIHDRLQGDGGGLISVYYHPCEWVHLEFWDGVNFRRGANPPREKWKAPPQRFAEETEGAFERFESYIDFQKSLGVKFVTASDLPLMYVDRARKEGIDIETAKAIVANIVGSVGIRFLKDKERILSVADQFTVLTELLGSAIDDGKLPAKVSVPLVLGPAEAPPLANEVEEFDWPSFRDTLLDVRDALRARQQIPSRIFAGAKKASPADFLMAMAQVADAILGPALDGKLAFPEKVHLPGGTFLWPERQVASDTAELFGGWIIHPEGFRAPRILEQARLQTWTLKPAR
jgi:hypothetical protein